MLTYRAYVNLRLTNKKCDASPMNRIFHEVAPKSERTPDSVAYFYPSGIGVGGGRTIRL